MDFMMVLAYIFSVLALGGGLMLFTRLQMPIGMAILPLRSLAVAFTPIESLFGLLGLFFGILSQSVYAAALGALGAALAIAHIVRILTVHSDFQLAFDKDWQVKLTPGLTKKMLPRRWTAWLPRDPQPCWDHDLAFWRIPGSQRDLLCDLWQPQDGTSRTGLAFIFFHGSAWYMLDKDFGTRIFFRHLVNQGHVVMDVAYRLFPEADMAGMIGDVRRAIAWMKQNAARLGVDPERIIIGGASAGGHLSLLSAFAGDTPGLTPPDLAGIDLAVRGVVSIYGPTDLQACYFKTHQDRTTRDTNPEVDPQLLAAASLPKKNGRRSLGFNKPSDTGAFVKMLGGHPEAVPEKYAFYSPVSYVHQGCPATLLIQGENDLIVSLEATKELENKLRDAGVRVVSAYYPQVDHAFDLVFPQISPSSQAAFYVIDRFLAACLYAL